jgi:hypothetical protein
MFPQVTARLAALRSAPPDSWVALLPDETKVIAVGATYSEVAEMSDHAGITDPVIVKVSAKWGPLSMSAS